MKRPYEPTADIATQGVCVIPGCQNPALILCEGCRFADGLSRATVLIAHPEDLKEHPEGFAQILKAHPQLEIVPDKRLDRGRLFAIDGRALDPFRN